MPNFNPPTLSLYRAHTKKAPIHPSSVYCPRGAVPIRRDRR